MLSSVEHEKFYNLEPVLHLCCLHETKLGFWQRTHIIQALMRENLSSGFAEQQRCRPACSLITPFVIRLLESVIYRLAAIEISIF